MDNLYCVICGKYRKCEKPKISLWYHFSLLVQEWIWKKIKEEESAEILKILGLIYNIEKYQNI